MAENVLTESLSEPLDGATTAKVYIDMGTGNLTIDRLPSEQEEVLASGTLQYLEKQGPPTTTFDSSNGQATLAVKGEGAKRSWFRLPWDACGGGAYEWQIHLNPKVQSDISAHSGGGNVKLDLAGMAITHLSADTGGGNVAVILPDNAADLHVLARTGGGNVTVEVGSEIRGIEILEARSGAGNVEVRLPGSIPALIHAHSGIGKVAVDPPFEKIEKETYRSPNYDGADNKVEITAHSGAGSVSVSTR